VTTHPELLTQSRTCQSRSNREWSGECLTGSRRRRCNEAISTDSRRLSGKYLFTVRTNLTWYHSTLWRRSSWQWLLVLVGIERTSCEPCVLMRNFSRIVGLVNSFLWRLIHACSAHSIKQHATRKTLNGRHIPTKGSLFHTPYSGVGMDDVRWLSINVISIVKLCQIAELDTVHVKSFWLMWHVPLAWWGVPRVFTAWHKSMWQTLWLCVQQLAWIEDTF